MGLAPDATHAQQSEAMEKYLAILKEPVRILYFPSGRFAPDEHGKIPHRRDSSPSLRSVARGLASCTDADHHVRGRIRFVTAAGIMTAISTNVFLLELWVSDHLRLPCLFSSSDFSWLASWRCIMLPASDGVARPATRHRNQAN
jgi:hypothetical protein